MNTLNYCYVDELMGLANILCDGAIYVDRKAFLMLLSSLMHLQPDQFILPEVMNSINFPLETIMSSLVFDFKLNPYTLKRIEVKEID